MSSEDVNKAVLFGTLGADPELRFTGSGKAVCTLRVATGKKKLDGTDATQWHQVVVWGKRAEGIAAAASKGTRVHVEGEITHRSYEGRDGGKKYVTEIVASACQVLGTKVSASHVPSYASGGASGGTGDYSQGGAKTPDDDDLPF